MRVCVPSSRRLAVCRLLRFLFASNKNFLLLLLLLLGNDVDVDVDVFVLCTHTDTHAQTDCEHRLRIAKRASTTIKWASVRRTEGAEQKQ